MYDEVREAPLWRAYQNLTSIHLQYQARHDKAFESAISAAPMRRTLLVDRVSKALLAVLQTTGDRLSKKVSGFTTEQLRIQRNRDAVRSLLSALFDATLTSLAIDPSARRELQSLSPLECRTTPQIARELASLVTRTPNKDIRRAGLEVLAGTLPYEQADAALRQAEYRAASDDTLIAELSECNSISSWQRKLLPTAASEHSNLSRFGMGRLQFNHLSSAFDEHLRNGTAHDAHYTCRVPKELILQALRDIESCSELGWSWERRTNPLTFEKGSYIYRTKSKTDLYYQYCQIRPEQSERVGRSTFYLLIDATTKKLESTSGISYWIADVNAAVTLLETITKAAMNLFFKLKAKGDWVDEAIDGLNSDRFAKGIESVKRAVQETFHRHARKPSSSCDRDVAHCTMHGMANCTSEHKLQCKNCAPAFFVPAQIIKVLNAFIASINRHRPRLSLAVSAIPTAQWTAYDELLSMKKAVSICGEAIKVYHAHSLRARWQYCSIRNILDSLDDETILVDFDYMMKVCIMSSHYVRVP